MTVPHTAVILLNWNGWKDTVACIASLRTLEDQGFVIVVCDNASTDDSWQHIRDWCDANPGCGYEIWAPGMVWSGTKQLALIQTGANLGFAGGCNVGLRFALQQTSCDFLWLLNNDTLVSSSALGSQVARMRQDSSLGMLGSTVVYADEPETVQCFGGYGFNFWAARVRPLPFAPDPKQAPSTAEVEKDLRYISGASLFTRRDFVEQVGLLQEQYFLYFEEIDWATRGKSFRLSYCPDSLVFHKEGRSIGSAKSFASRSEQSEAWLTRNRILFTRSYFKARLPVTLAWVFAVAFIRGVRHPRVAATLMRGTWQGITAPIQPLPKMTEWRQETLGAAAVVEPESASIGKCGAN